jgi:hypothetical protein
MLDLELTSGPVVLELPYPCLPSLKRALLRCIYRRAAKALRDELGYLGAARALEDLAATMQTPVPDPVGDFDGI